MYCPDVASDQDRAGLSVRAPFRGGIKAHAGDEEVAEVQGWQEEKNMNWL